MVCEFIRICSSKAIVSSDNVSAAFISAVQTRQRPPSQTVSFGRLHPPLLKYHTFLSSEWDVKIDTGLSFGLSVFRTDVAS